MLAISRVAALAFIAYLSIHYAGVVAINAPLMAVSTIAIFLDSAKFGIKAKFRLELSIGNHTDT